MSELLYMLGFLFCFGTVMVSGILLILWILSPEDDYEPVRENRRLNDHD